MDRIPAIIEERIRRREHSRRNIRTDSPKSLFFAGGSGDKLAAPLASGPMKWQCAYFSEEKYVYSADNTAAGRTSITYDHTDSGTGTFDPDALTYTDDGAPGWTPDEWINHYLKVGDNYYKITDNDASSVTLDIAPGQVISDGAYNIYPFVPNMFRGAFFYPDENSDWFYIIKNNSTTVIYVDYSQSVFILTATAQVTTGDAGAPYDTFRATDFDGYPDDYWNNYSIIFKDGDNAGETDVISDFTGATGEFVLETGVTHSIDVNDWFRIERSLLWVSVGATFKIFSGYIPGPDDFSGISDPELIRFRDVQVEPDGTLIDNNMPSPYVGRYAVEIYSMASKSFASVLRFKGAVKVILRNLATTRAQMVFQSSGYTSQQTSILFNLSLRTWYRVEIYYYIPGLIVGDLRLDGIKSFINTWRDVTPGAPTGLSVTGTYEGFQLSWTNYPILGAGAITQIWICDTEDGTYTLDGVVPIDTDAWQTSHYDPEETKWFKLRHISASGVEGSYCSAVSDATTGEIIGRYEFLDCVEFAREV